MMISFIENIIERLRNLEKQCVICSKMDYTMGRYLDVIFYLWSKEKDSVICLTARKALPYTFQAAA